MFACVTRARCGVLFTGFWGPCRLSSKKGFCNAEPETFGKQMVFVNLHRKQQHNISFQVDRTWAGTITKHKIFEIVDGNQNNTKVFCLFSSSAHFYIFSIFHFSNTPKTPKSNKLLVLFVPLRYLHLNLFFHMVSC